MKWGKIFTQIFETLFILFRAFIGLVVAISPALAGMYFANVWLLLGVFISFPIGITILIYK